VIYISTGQGADCAIDANVGRILWLQVTDSAKNQRSANEYYVQQQGASAWKFNPPMVYGNELVSYESSGAAGAAGAGWLRVYDRWTGQLLTKATRAQLHVGAADIVAGISGNKLILAGQNVSAIDLDTVKKDPQAVWTVGYPSVSEAGKPCGRTFLTQDILYVPFEKGLFTVDVRAGKKKDFWPWPKNDKDVPGKGGNLLVTSEQVVVINDQEIAGYSRWETARDNRLKAIAANPGAPEPYLALAEISFRTGHLDLAEENMRKAVDLANAAAGTGSAGSSSVMEMLDRLYRTNLNFAEQLLGKAEADLTARSRFYFEQCKATARGAEQQAEWRLDLSDLSLKENKPEEAATLFNDVLTDSALREASFHQGDTMARAGVMAETRFRSLIDKNGDGVYKPFEQQAAAQLAQAGTDGTALQRVVDQYPNSAAAATAAQRTAAAMAAKGDFEGQRKALSWLYPRVSGDEKAHVTAQLAMANLALKRFATADGWAERGLRQFKSYSWTSESSGAGGTGAGTMTFETLLTKVKAARPAEAEGRLPMLPPPTKDADGRPVGPPDMDEASTSTPVKDAHGKAIDTDGTFARGTLLAPIETAAMYSRPNMLFVSSAQTIRAFDTSSGTPMEKGDPVRLAGTGPTAALVGCYGDVAVFAQNRAVTGVDLNTMKEAWQVKFNFSVRDSMARNAQPNIPPGAQQVVINGRLVIINGGVVQEDGANIASVDLTGDPETARRAALQQLSAPAFSTLKMIGDKLVVVSGGKVHAYGLKTGKPVWTDESGGEVTPQIPENCNPVALSGNDDLVTLQLERTDKPGASFLIIDGDSGKLRRQLTLAPEERVYWRGLSGDGMLFVVSDQAVSAYDLMNDSDKPAWRRSDIQSRYPAATQVTLDGLIFVNSYNEVMCLSPEGGEARWPLPGTQVRLDIPAGQTSNGQYPFLRSVVDGDMVIYESTLGVSAYFTYPRSADDGQLAWEAPFTSNTTPPLESMQMSDPYVVVMAEGPMQTAQHAVHLVLINRKGGKRHMDKQLHRSASPQDIEGPQIQAWMLADNGIALAVNGHVYFYHGKTPVSPPAAGEQTQTQAAPAPKAQG
jgi:outer membrane protein assembly factor BamB